MIQNRLLSHFDYKIRVLQAKIKEEKKKQYLCEDFRQAVIKTLEGQIQYYYHLYKKWENYRQNYMTGEDKNG